MKLPSKETLETVYGDAKFCKERFEALARAYQSCFAGEEAAFFTAPGRTEIVGNHTDHNGGKVLAASIDMDTIGAAYPNDSEIIEIVSEGYAKKIVVDIRAVDTVAREAGTLSLVAGMVKAVQEYGFRISGFQAYVSTEVISSAGVSSSASFEMLFCAIVNYFFNENQLSYLDYAMIGQYAENHYWNKASGRMDQLSCAAGGTVLMDFRKNNYSKVKFQFEDYGYRMVIVNTGKGHADLSKEYSLIPAEMKAVAAGLGVPRLSDSHEEVLLDKIPAIAEQLGNDRAILRAIHFYEENRRVEQMVEAIAEHKRDLIKELICASGQSSWELLQNCYSLDNYMEQKVTLCLALTDRFIKRKGDGCCRVHGGGFAGVIMSIIAEQDVEDYIAYISRYVGRKNVYPMHIREAGAVHLE